MPGIAGHHVDKNPAFEALHPRDRSGHDRGQFVDVPGLFKMLGGRWDEGRGVWLVPQSNRSDLKQALDDIGMDAIHVPPGMRPMREEDRSARFGPGTKIPPGWTDVMVADDPKAPVQVVGRDSKGRRQRIQSVEFSEQGAAAKFARVRALETRIGDVDAALNGQALRSDTAAVAMLIRKMGLRPGSVKDTKGSVKAYGATTLERRHVKVRGNVVSLDFIGKEGVRNQLELEDSDLAKVLKRRILGKEGHERLWDVNDKRLNAWFKTNAGGATAKDFRTRLATAEARGFLDDLDPPQDDKQARLQQLRAGDHVAKILGNNRNQALASYIDPSVFETTQASLGSARRSQMVSAFHAGHTEGEELTGGNMSLSVKRVTLSDGTEAVLKGHEWPGEARREFLSGVISNVLGLDSSTADLGDNRTLSSFIDGTIGMEHIGARGIDIQEGDRDVIVDLPGSRELGIMDWLIRNRDRHNGNWIVSRSGRVAPIDHGMTFFTPDGADRDVPRSMFARHWVGYVDKPSARSGFGVDPALRAKPKNPKIGALRPLVSKKYLEELRSRLELNRDEFSDTEWSAVIARLEMLVAAAPDTIDDEPPMEAMT
jgi:DNA topoisomerase IB